MYALHALLEQLGYMHTKSNACICMQSKGRQYHYFALYVNVFPFI